MQKLSALIIEDSVELAEIFSDILRVEGLTTEVIFDGKTALKRLETANPDVIMLDMHLPGVSGIDILRSIRNDARLAKTKVIVVTADGLILKQAEELADLVLMKPVSYMQIRELSCRVLGIPSRKVA